MFNFAIAYNIAIATLKFANKGEQRYKGIKSLNLNNLLNGF